jgi:hypothetical protein
VKKALPTLLLLAATLACDPMARQGGPPTYAPWEEGLTLVYEDPSRPPEDRVKERQQVRVKEAKPTPAGRVVTLSYASLSSHWESSTFQRQGGVYLGAAPTEAAQVLPEGFPDRVNRWEGRNRTYWVVGRATRSLPGVHPAGSPGATGVWVESAPLSGEGPRRRTFYLPDIGEAESLEWRGGQWVCVLRLASRGFTDVPESALAPGR